MNESMSMPALAWLRWLCAVSCYLAMILPAWAETPATSEKKVWIGEPATLTVWNRPIIVFRATLNESETPKDKVARVLQRFESLPYQSLGKEVRAEHTKVGDLEGLLVMVGDQILFGILPEDLDPESGETLEQARQKVVSRVREVLQAQAEQQSLPVLLRGIAFSAGASVLFGVTLWLTMRLRNRFLSRLEPVTGALPETLLGVDIRPHLRSLERWLIKLTGFGIVLMALFLWLTFVLRQFPYSQPWGDSMGAYLRGVLINLGSGAVAAVPGFFTVLIIFLLTRLVSRSVGGFFRSVEEGRLKIPWMEVETAKATRRLAIVLIWVFALTVAYPYIPGSSSEAFKGISVLIGLMISLGSTGFVNQVMSGLVVVYARTFKTGEYVRVGETEGVVSEIGVLATKIVNRKREEISIPNALLVGTTVTNYSRLADERGAIVATAVTIGYDTPWRQVHALLTLAAERTQGVRKQPAPFILQRQLADFYVEYQLLVHIDRAEDRIPILSELHAHIQDAFNEFGVQIMSPHFVTQPSQAVVVPKEQWHTPPAFREQLDRTG